MADLHRWTDPYTDETVCGWEFDWAVASHEPGDDASLDPTTQRLYANTIRTSLVTQNVGNLSLEAIQIPKYRYRIIGVRE